MRRTDIKSETAQPPERWTAAQHLIWTHYDDADEWVVFHPSSATVHLVNESARFLWTLIADRNESTFDQLAAALAEYLGQAADRELIEATREALDWMDDAGLIVPGRS